MCAGCVLCLPCVMCVMCMCLCLLCVSVCVPGCGGWGGGEGQASFPKGTNLVSGRSNSERPGAFAGIFNPASGKPAAGEARPWAQWLELENCVCAKIWLCTCVWVH